MDCVKVKKWLTPLLAVVAVAAVVCTALYFAKPQAPKIVTLSDDEFLDALPVSVQDGEKEFRQSDIPGIFYTKDPIQFYEWKDDKLAPVTDMVSVPVTMNIFNSAQKITFELRYVRRGTQVTGFGEYRMDPDKAETVLISDYYFIHAITLPPSVKVDRNKNCLLLIDSKKEPVEDPLRVYEETFFFGTESNKAYDRYIPDGSRAIDPLTGGKNRGHAMFTTSQVLNATSKRTLYFTTSKYVNKGANENMELRSIQGTYTSTAATNIAYLYARDTENGLLTLRENKAGDGFDVYWNSKVALSLPGAYDSDYLHSGDWLLPLGAVLNQEKVTITNIATKATFSLPLSPQLREISAFSVSPDGKKVILAGISATDASDGGKQQTLLFYDLENGAHKQLTGAALFRNQLPLMCWIDNNTFAYNCTNFENGDKPQLCVARFADALKSNTVEVTQKAN